MNETQSMSVSQAIVKRRAVKAFDPQHKMSEQEIAKLMSLAMLSPTAFNIQNWRFVVVTDAALRKQIRAVSWDQAQVEEASLLIILTADLNAWQKILSAIGRMHPNQCKIIWCLRLAVITKITRKCSAMKACAAAAWRRKPLCWPPKKWATTPARWMASILTLSQNSSTCPQTTYQQCLWSLAKH